MKAGFDTRTAAKILGVSPSVLNKARVTGDGPNYFKFGARVVYDPDDLYAWAGERRRRSTSDETRAA